MSKRANEFQSIQDLMGEMLTENNLQKGIDELAVKAAWREVMGPGILSYTDTLELKNKTLIVRLSSAALRQELSYGKDKIVVMMNENLKKSIIKRIKLL